jgi:hypothetical protein
VSEAAVAKNEKLKNKDTESKAGPPKTREQRGAEKQALAMWALLGAGGAAYGGKLKPQIEKSEREALQRAGLIEAEKRERGALWLIVTDRGWAWAEQHLGDSLPDKSFGGAFVLQAWLTRLQVYLQKHGIRLAELFVAPPAPTSAAPDTTAPPDHAELREQIRAAYLEVAGGFNRRALLSELRAMLGDIDRTTLDTVLKQMQREEEASLMQLDNRMDITEADRSAALHIGSEPRHILWISK